MTYDQELIDIVYGVAAYEANNHGGMYDGKCYTPDEAIELLKGKQEKAVRAAKRSVLNKVRDIVPLYGTFRQKIDQLISETEEK